VISGVSDTRGSVSACRLQENLFGSDVRQLRPNEVGISLVGSHIYVFFRYYLGIAIESGLEKRAPRPEEVEKLFRIFLSAKRPKPASYTATHDNTIIILHADSG
jgi:hypothetical protein